MNNPAIVVPKADVDSTLRTLRKAGVYDDTRALRQSTEGTVEIPVTSPPANFKTVIDQIDPPQRLTGLEDRLEAAGWTPDELDRIPRSWAVIGDVILVRIPEACPQPRVIAETLLDLHGADTVLARQEITGEHREPTVTVLAGSGDTETIHTEHGTKYALDLATVMFSPGNKSERVRMGEITSAGDHVLDMFAGVGYFTLPMARAGAHVTAIERNPQAFRFLVENAPLNDVDSLIQPFLGDCRDITKVLVDAGEQFDRVVMGYYDAAEYLHVGIPAVATGGRLHMHEAAPNPELWDRPVTRLKSTAADLNRDVEILDRRRVKTHSEGVTHVVIDAIIE